MNSQFASLERIIVCGFGDTGGRVTGGGGGGGGGGGAGDTCCLGGGAAVLGGDIRLCCCIMFAWLTTIAFPIYPCAGTVSKDCCCESFFLTTAYGGDPPEALSLRVWTAVVVVLEVTALLALPGVAMMWVPSAFDCTRPPSGNCTDITTGVTVFFGLFGTGPGNVISFT